MTIRPETSAALKIVERLLAYRANWHRLGIRDPERGNGTTPEEHLLKFAYDVIREEQEWHRCTGL